MKLTLYAVVEISRPKPERKAVRNVILKKVTFVNKH